MWSWVWSDRLRRRFDIDAVQVAYSLVEEITV